jgi:hypothetical protein
MEGVQPFCTLLTLTRGRQGSQMLQLPLPSAMEVDHRSLVLLEPLSLC